MSKLAEYAKGIVALLTGASAWGMTATADGVYTAAEWWALVGVAATALAVVIVPNKAPEDPQDPEPPQALEGLE